MPRDNLNPFAIAIHFTLPTRLNLDTACAHPVGAQTRPPVSIPAWPTAIIACSPGIASRQQVRWPAKAHPVPSDVTLDDVKALASWMTCVRFLMPSAGKGVWS